jgi:SAM-dependent methyltransferase
MRFLLTPVFLVSAAAIAYEILLIRLLSIIQWHHFAWMIISLALLGYGASGTLIALARRWLEPRFDLAFVSSALLFSITMVGCFLLGQNLPFNALEIVWNPRQLLYLGLLYLVFMVPFGFAAFCIGLAFTCRNQQVDRIYFADLVGAGCGALVLIAVLFVLQPQQALILLSATALMASAGFARSRKLQPRAARGLIRTGQLAWLLVLVMIFPADRIELRISEFKGLSQALQVTGARVLTESSSPLGQLTVVESPEVPFRHVPGLSLNSSHVPADQLAVFTDGDGISVITRLEHSPEELGWLGDVPPALPYRLLERPKVLILGAGAGGGVLLALHHGADRVDAVELNPQMVELLRGPYADWSGQLYDHDRVKVHVSEARGFVTRSTEFYDLIQVGLLDSFAVSGSGVQSLNENYLYTVEAIRSYLERLKPGGILAITRWLKVPPRDSLKLAATLLDAMRLDGVDRPGRQLAVIRSWNTVTLLARNGEFTNREISIIRNFARLRSFDTAYYPSMPPGEANRFNRLDRPWLFEGIIALTGEDAGRFLDDYKFYIRAATDDRPYFFHFFKWRVLPEVLELRRRGGAGLVEWGYLVLAATLLQALFFGLLFILLPLLLARRDWPPAGGGRMGAYFFLLGLAFLFVEMAFIQKFILFLSHPIYSVAVVLAGFLIFAGLGSRCSVNFAIALEKRGRSPVRVAVSGIVVFALSYIFLLPWLFAQCMGQADTVRILVALATIAPLAFCMGLPFPLGLRFAAGHAPGFIPWAWGINGFASVVSATLATLLAIELGFTAVLLLALVFYVLASFLFVRLND